MSEERTPVALGSNDGLGAWQPIATAPRDGRPVWVKGVNWGRPSEGWHCCWAYWNGHHWLSGRPDDEACLEHLRYWLPGAASA